MKANPRGWLFLVYGEIHQGLPLLLYLHAYSYNLNIDGYYWV